MRLSVLAAVLLGACLLSPSARAQAGQDNFSIDVSRSTREVKVGDKGSLTFVIVPGKGKKVHEQAPLIVSLRAPASVTLAKGKLGHPDVVNPGAPSPEVKVEFTAKQPGEQPVEADLTFFICTEKWCERQQQKVSVPLSVK